MLETLVRALLQPLVPGVGLVLLGATAVWMDARWRGRQWGWGVLAGGVLVVWLPATMWVAHPLVERLEAQHPPRPIVTLPSADAIVVLGGSAGAPVPPRQAPDLHDASDRIWLAARLYRAGKAPVVVASGGGEDAPAEAPVMHTVLTDWGVPDSVIVQDSTSQSTYENARNTATLLRRHRPADTSQASGAEAAKVLLVTSAMHMPRAAATFRAQGLTVHPAPTDVRITEASSHALLPTAAGLELTTAALHEYAATVLYRWRGVAE